jgi:integrative and conjugative element protein (TIGR02256 family)
VDLAPAAGAPRLRPHRPARRRGGRALNRAWIRPAALDGIRLLAADRHPLETGGLLLGWNDAASGDAVIAEIVGPGAAAKHRHAAFSPDHPWQRDELARRYAASGRLHGYLGDWHTHPGGGGHPSRRDRRTAASIARAPLARAPRPLMAILADGPDGPLCVWRYARGRPFVRLRCLVADC